MKFTHLVHIFKGIDDIVGQAGQQVNNKPRLQVVHSYQLCVWNDLPSRTHEGGVEVKHDVDQEDDVHHAVQHQPNQVVLFGLKRDVIGHHDGGVEGEDEDDPVPGGLEGAVVEDDVWRGLGGLLFVLRHDVWSQLESL